MPGVVKDEQAVWLLARVDECKSVEALAALVNVCAEAQRAPDWFVAAAEERRRSRMVRPRLRSARPADRSFQIVPNSGETACAGRAPRAIGCGRRAQEAPQSAGRRRGGPTQIRSRSSFPGGRRSRSRRPLSSSGAASSAVRLSARAGRLDGRPGLLLASALSMARTAVRLADFKADLRLLPHPRTPEELLGRSKSARRKAAALAARPSAGRACLRACIVPIETTVEGKQGPSARARCSRQS